MTDRLITIEQQIAAPRADVWRVLADFPNIADWNSGVKVSRATSSATGGIGATRHCDLIPAGGLDETVTDWQDEQRLVISIDKATIVPIDHAQITFILESSPSDDLTRTVIEYRYRPKGGPLRRLVGPLVDRQLANGFAGFLVDLERAAQRTD